MSLHEYQQSTEIAQEDRPFYALIMAAMRQADSDNMLLLRTVFPDTWMEFNNRYHSVGGIIPSDGEPVRIEIRELTDEEVKRMEDG